MEKVKCKNCDGSGYVAEHDLPENHGEDGECISCPVKAYCEVCEGKGEVEDVCETCGGDGFIEIMGDGENFEWDVIDTKPCPNCSGVDTL